jgi:hypothetical protein
MIEIHRYRRASRSDSAEGRNKVGGEQLSGGEQIKAKGVGKGGWETMKRDGKLGSVNWTGVACQPLFPGETPMRAPGAGQDAFRRGGAGRRRGLGEVGQTNGFAVDYFQPSSPDATAGPVSPQHRSKRQRC